MRKVTEMVPSPLWPSKNEAPRRWLSCATSIPRRKRSTKRSRPEARVDSASSSISWTSSSSPRARAWESHEVVDLAIGPLLVLPNLAAFRLAERGLLGSAGGLCLGSVVGFLGKPQCAQPLGVLLLCGLLRVVIGPGGLRVGGLPLFLLGFRVGHSES